MKYAAFFLTFFLPLFLLSGCHKESSPTYQGYAEGEFVNISSTQSGKLDKLFIKRGDKVSIGTHLFALECESELFDYEQIASDLAAAHATLEDYQKGSRPEEISVIEAQLSQAIANAENAQANYDRNRLLYPSHAISKTQLDDSEALIKTTKAKVKELQNTLNVAQLPKRSDQITAQKGRIAQLKAALSQAQWRVKEKALTSHLNAMVYDTLYREGEFVPMGGVVVRLLPSENIKVRFFVPQKIAETLQIGHEISIIKRNDGKKIDAKVTYISPEAEYTPPIIYSNETKEKLTFMIEAYPENKFAPLLHPGQPVEISLE